MKYLFFSILIVVLSIRFYVFFKTPKIYNNGDKVRIKSRVATEPIKYSDSQYLRLQGLKIYLPLFPEISYGDRVIVEGVVDNDKLKKAELIESKSNEGLLFEVRKKLLNVYQRALPTTDAALIAGVTIGSKASIPRDFWDVLKISGTAHVVVASGMNVTLVAGFLMSLLTGMFTRKRAIPLALAGVWVYSIISGFDAPIIRAAIMGSIAFTAQEMGRIYYSIRALIITAVAMLMIKPEWIVDLGFVLSFVATGSLILFGPFISRKMRYVPGVFRQSLSTSLAAQIGVAPILYYTFGQFNPFSPLINAVTLWTIPPMTIIGLVGGVVGLIYLPIGKLVLMLSYPLTSWFVFIVKHAG